MVVITGFLVDTLGFLIRWVFLIVITFPNPETKVKR